MSLAAATWTRRSLSFSVAAVNPSNRGAEKQGVFTGEEVELPTAYTTPARNFTEAVSFREDRRVLKVVDRICRRSGSDRSAIYREAVRFWLEEKEHINLDKVLALVCWYGAMGSQAWRLDGLRKQATKSQLKHTAGQ